MSADSASDRLGSTVRAALAGSPQLDASLAEAAVEAASLRSEAGITRPWVELGTEGLGSSFDRQPNAQNTVAVGTEVLLPWHVGTARGLTRSADDLERLSSRAAITHLSGAVASVWLDTAAAVERETVEQRRLERLDHALALQEARYQLGEIAGTEVRQLDLEHVRESSRLASTAAQVAALGERLRELAGDGWAAPRAGDLADLVVVTRTGEESPSVAGALPEATSAAAEAAGLRARLAAGTAFGRPELQLEWESIPTVDGVPGHDAVGAAVRLPLPIGRAGHQERARARAESRAAEARAASELRAFERRITAAHEVARGAERRLSVLRSVLADMEETEHALSEQFRLGAISYLVYIDGLSRLDEVRLEAVDARLQLLLARLDLALLSGDTTYFPALPGSDVEEE